MRQFSECSKNHIELLKKIRKVSLCVLEYIEKFNAGGFSVKLEWSEGKVSLEQGYALKKIIPLSQCGPTCVLHAMHWQGHTIIVIVEADFCDQVSLALAMVPSVLHTC